MTVIKKAQSSPWARPQKKDWQPQTQHSLRLVLTGQELQFSETRNSACWRRTRESHLEVLLPSGRTTQQLEAFACEGQKHSWCGRVSASQIACHLQSRSAYVGYLYSIYHHTTNSFLLLEWYHLWEGMGCHPATELRNRGLQNPWWYPLHTMTFIEVKGLMKSCMDTLLRWLFSQLLQG